MAALGTLKIDTVENDAGEAFDVGNISNGQCTAWCKFNQTGTQAIIDSFNVSSITDIGVGKTQVNFANAMANANYALGGITTGAYTVVANVAGADSTAKCDVGCYFAAYVDQATVSVNIHGGL